MSVDDAQRAEVQALVEQWLVWDQDAETREQVQQLLRAEDHEQLSTLMRPRIAFGTAGLRARAEAGFARINSLVLLQATQGLAEHVLSTRVARTVPLAIVGHDGRRDSKKLARTATAAFTAKGFNVLAFPHEVPTPLVPFAIRERAADVGVVITASHNPKEDNGFKVYNRLGCQINTPEDQAISSSILATLEPSSWTVDTSCLSVDEKETLGLLYFEKLRVTITPRGRPPRAVYTAMHGVGLPFILHAYRTIFSSSEDSLAKDRFPSSVDVPGLSVVAAQALPDANFPTVRFPNPEESGALDLAKQQADAEGVDFVLANDPDADRFAAAQKWQGEWHQFGGDEIGVLLAIHIWETRPPVSSATVPLMLRSAVSSQMLDCMGQAEGFEVQETLTGFKWIGNRAREAADRVLFGYEEALGYMLPAIVYDKDGISAAMLFLAACASWDISPYEKLQVLHSKYGHFQTCNTYFKSPSVLITQQYFSKIQERPDAIRASFGPSTQCRVRDLAAGTDTGTPSGKAELPGTPDALMVTLWLSGDNRLADGVRCTIRASGTEPKIKGKSPFGI